MEVIPIPNPPKTREITIRTTPFTTVFFPPLSSQPVAHFITPIMESITPIPKQIITRKAKALLKIVPIRGYLIIWLDRTPKSPTQKFELKNKNTTTRYYFFFNGRIKFHNNS